MKELNVTTFMTIKNKKNKLTIRNENKKSCMTYTFYENKNLSINDFLIWQQSKIKEAIIKHKM